MILEPKKIKSVTVSIVPPSICLEVLGPNATILVFWMLSFKPAFSLSYFTFIKRLFSSSSLFALRVVSSAYLRLLIFLLAILIQLVLHPAQHFAWCTLHISQISRVTICSLTILLSQFGTSPLFHVSSKCCFLNCIQISKVIWYSHLFKHFPVCCDPHNQRL